MFYWMMLFLAIITEVVGTSVMSVLSKSSPIEAQGIISIAIALSYYFLSKAIARIPMGITFAVWEGVGITAITAISWFLFHETLSLYKILGIMFIVCGVVILQCDSVKKKISPKKQEQSNT